MTRSKAATVVTDEQSVLPVDCHDQGNPTHWRLPYPTQKYSKHMTTEDGGYKKGGPKQPVAAIPHPGIDPLLNTIFHDGHTIIGLAWIGAGRYASVAYYT